MSTKSERIFVVNILDKKKYLEVTFRRNAGKEFKAISKDFHYFKDTEGKYIWCRVEHTPAGVLFLHEGRPFPGGDLSIDQRLRVVDQAVRLTQTLLQKEEIGPKRATGLISRFYENICNTILGDISRQDDRQDARKDDDETPPANCESIKNEEVENGFKTFEKDTPIQSPSGLGG
jgi:hypothetical protein